MASPGHLCEYCIKVPLDGHIKQPDSGPWALGPWTRLKDSDCPFCKFVTSAFQLLNQTASREEVKDLSRIKRAVVEWVPPGFSGPGGRDAFTIQAKTWGVWLCRAAESSMVPSLDPKPGFMQSTSETDFDVRRLRKWISICTTAHSEHCVFETGDFEQTFPGLPVLRLIDVFQDKLIELRSVPKYVTLSYVWGNSTSVRLTDANRLELLRPGGLSKAWSMIPRTIQDAIQLARRLGAPYLWVDALCLIQNNPGDLAAGIHVMDQIYESSWLTIVVACGHNADSGIPGVQEGSRPEVINVSKITEDTSYGLYLPLDRALRDTVYASRAWTFQEHLLARRAIFFVGNQVYFRCRQDIYSEQLIDHRAGQGGLEDEYGVGMEAITRMRHPVANFKFMLQLYTQRALSDQTDVLRAMAGIIRRLESKTRRRFLQGLPTAAFDAFILFRSRSIGVLRRRSGFPSYSWAGWKGGITLGPHDSHGISSWLETPTWITWYERSPTGIINPIRSYYTQLILPNDKPMLLDYKARYRIGDRLGLLRDDVSYLTGPTINLPFRLPAAYPVLQFWTYSLIFRLQMEDIFNGTASIMGRHGKVGTVSLDGVEDTDFFDRTDFFEFIIISIAISAYREKKQQNEKPGDYFVMLLEWKDHVAERRGLGDIEESALLRGYSPGPVWKEIILG